jgi:hypothetical protein
MGNSLYLIENLKVFLRNSCHPLIYFKSVPKSTKFIRPPPSLLSERVRRLLPILLIYSFRVGRILLEYTIFNQTVFI